MNALRELYIRMQLQKRYPTVRIVEVSAFDSGKSLSIRFQAPLDELKRCGLVTTAIIQNKEGCTEFGDKCSLYRKIDCESRPGCWDLFAPIRNDLYERHMSVRVAAQLLRRIAKAGA